MLPDRRDPNPVVAWALWWDGVFELVLGCFLASAPFTGLLGALGLPAPASPPRVVGFGFLLLPVGIWLLILSRRWSAGLVTVLGILNAAGAVLFGVWLGWAWGGFAPLGRQVTAGVALVLAVLATVELMGMRRRA